MRIIEGILILFVIGCSITGCFANPIPSNGTTTLISITSAGTPVNGPTYNPSISGDSRYVAFESDANNLNQLGTGGANQIYMHDRMTGLTSLISHDSEGYPASGESTSPAISSDGNYIVFTSDADNLVIDDSNNQPDIFLWNRTSDEIRCVSTDNNGNLSDGASIDPVINANGTYVAFSSWGSNLISDDNNDNPDIFRKNIITSQVDIVSKGPLGLGNGASLHPAISGSGEIVAFDSFSSNFVNEDQNHKCDIFLKNISNDDIQIISKSSDGIVGDDSSSNPSLDSTGNIIAFSSFAKNFNSSSSGFSSVFFKDLNHNILKKIPDVYETHSNGYLLLSQGSSSEPVISADGKIIAFQSGIIETQNGNSQISDKQGDVFLFRIDDSSITKGSVRTNGILGDGGISSHPSLSDDGKAIVFSSDDNSLSDKSVVSSSIYLHQLFEDTSAPVIISIEPTFGYVNSLISMNISGRNFYGGERIDLMQEGLENITQFGILKDGFLFVPEINLTNVTPGIRSVWVTNLTNQKIGILTNAFEIAPEKLHTITASASHGGNIEPSGEITLKEGSNQTFNITPDFTYCIAEVTVDRQNIGKVNNYQFEDIANNHTIHVNFTSDHNINPQIFSIEPIGGIPGSIISWTIRGDHFLPNAQVKLVIDNSSEFYATDVVVSSPYQINGVFSLPLNSNIGLSYVIVEQENSQSNQYPFIIHPDHSYGIYAKTDDLGWISPSGLLFLPEKSNQKFSFQPTAGAIIQNVTLNGEEVNYNSNLTYTLQNISQNYLIELNNRPIPGLIIAGFSVTQTQDPFTLIFNDTSKSDIPSNMWRWDFGDGSQSSNQNEMHVYHQAGLYTISFWVRNDLSQSQRIFGDIKVPIEDNNKLILIYGPMGLKNNTP